MNVTYADREPSIPKDLADRFDAALAKELQAFFELAGAATASETAMEIAADIYSNDLGRL